MSLYANDIKLKRLDFSLSVLTLSYLTSCWHYLGNSGVFFVAGTALIGVLVRLSPDLK